MADSGSNYLKPKVKTGSLGERKEKNGQFCNVPSYPDLGGFSSAQKWPAGDKRLSLEKTPSSQKGKPI